MKKVLLLAFVLSISAFLTAQHVPATISLPWAGDYAQNMSTLGMSAFVFAEDPYAAVPTIYFTGLQGGESPRYVYKMVDPLFELGNRDISAFATVPVIIDRGEGDVEEDWNLWTYLTGIAVSENYVFTGGKTHKTQQVPNPDYDPADPDSPETITVTADTGGFYVVRYNKSDGSVDSVFKNNVSSHHHQFLLHYNAGEEQTFYVDSAGQFTEEYDPDGTAYTGQESLIVSQVGRGIFAIDPEKPAGEFTYGSGTLFERGFSPSGWCQILRTNPRDMAYDYDSGDLYIAVSGTSAAVAPDAMHEMWGGRYGDGGTMYQDGFPAYANPGVIRMTNFNPFKYDWGMNDGQDTLEVLTLEGVETNNFMGIHLFTYDDAKFLILTDYAGNTVYFYYLHEKEVPFKEYNDVDAYLIRTLSYDNATNPITVQSGEGDLYLFVGGGWTMGAWGMEIEVFGMPDEATFSEIWHLFD